MAFVENNSLQNFNSVADAFKGYTPKSAEITFFSVLEVHPDDRKIDIEFAHSKIVERNISYVSPVVNQNYGQDFIPSKGDIGIVATTAMNGRIVLGFISGANRSGGIKVAEGDMLTKSSDMAIVKQDASGNILLMTEHGANIMLTRSGSLLSAATESERSTETMKEFSGEINGQQVFEQVFFEELAEVYYADVDSLIEAIIKEEHLQMVERLPILRVSAINKLDPNGIPEIVDIYMDGENSRAIYQIEVLDPANGNRLSSITLDKSGNIKVEATKIVYAVDVVEYR